LARANALRVQKRGAMEGFTIIDGIVALVIVVSAILAYSRGFVREGMAIAGWIVAAILGYMFAPKAVPLVKEVPYLGDYISGSCELSVITGFFAVFAVALIVVSIFTPLFSSVVQRSALNGLDQAAGFLFGVFRGVLLVAVAFFVYQTVLSSQNVAMVDNSRSAVVFSNITGKIAERDPEATLSWVTAQYQQLVGECGAPAE